MLDYDQRHWPVAAFIVYLLVVAHPLAGSGNN
jgi:hypothetical protein